MTAGGGMRTDRLAGLQLGRAIAAIAVVVGHAIAHPYANAPGLTHLMGRYGVTIFFVISGFIMVHTTGMADFDARRFLTRRLVRVVPLYYVATFTLVVLTLLVPSAFKSTVFDVRHIIASLLFVPQYRPGDPDLIAPFFRLGWTLNYEMFFYVVFAGLFFLSAMTRAATLSAVFAVLILIGLWFQPMAAVPRFYTEMSILGFAAGMWVAILSMRRGGGADGVQRRWLTGLSIASLVAMAMLYEHVRYSAWTQAWLVVTCAAQVLVLASAHMAVPRPLVIAGDASYSMYLFHMFAIGFVTAIERLVPPSFVYAMIVLAAVLGIASGVVVHYIVELPLNRWVRRYFEPRLPRAIEVAPVDGGDRDMPLAEQPQQR